jgi:hypothetical protein
LVALRFRVAFFLFLVDFFFLAAAAIRFSS